MLESPHKKIKFTEKLPEDLVEYIISTFLPIQSVLQNRLVSKKFKTSEIRSRDLDFSGIYTVRRRQLAVVSIIEDIFNRHKGSEINRFVLILNHIGVEDKILSWIKTCLGKNIQELVLDFSKSKEVIDITIDFSAINTLTVLKLKWCKFEIPNNSPKGLKFLRTLSLMKTDVTNDIVDSILRNCIHLETLELIKCRMYEILSINAKNHKKFMSLVVVSMPNLLHILVDAPTLECFTYNGFVRIVDFSRVDALKEAYLHYNRSFDWHYYDSSDVVLANIGAFTGVRVLVTTNIFLEALTYRYNDGEMSKPTLRFFNLKEFHILFKAPTICNLYHIAEFLKHCPKLGNVSIDIKNFTFEPEMFWMIHHKPKIMNYKYELNSIKKVKINGYKGHWHEIDIVEFFVRNAKSLKKLKLKMLRNTNNRAHGLDYARINFIKSIFPEVKVKEV